MLFRLFTIIAVVALAMFSWSLTSPGHRPQTAAGNESELPGYYLKNAVLTDFDADGNPSVRLEAERIDQVGHTDAVTLSTVKVDYKPPGGEAWVLTGDHGQVEPGDKVVDVQGNVKLQGDPTGPKHDTPIVYTDTLSYNIPDGIATTSADVRLVFGAQTLNARGLTANLKDQTMHLESKVNGRFHR
jgi:LPS export ABC transporter protein LptC